MSNLFEELLAVAPWLSQDIALLVIGGLAVVIIGWLIGRGVRRRKPVVHADADLRILLADIAGEMRESASATLFGHFARDLTGAGREPPIAVIRHTELIGVEDETGEVDLAEPDQVELTKARRGEDADLLVWGRARLDDGTVTLRFAPAETTVDTGNPTKFSPAELTVPYAELSLGPGAILSTALLGSVATIARERGLKLHTTLKPLVDRLQAVTRSEARDLPEQCRYDALRALAWGWLTLGFENDDIDAQARAADTYKELLRFERPRTDAREEAELHLNYAAASLAVGEAREDSEAMENAVRSSLAALDSYGPESRPAEWAFLQDRFARASAWLGVQESDTAKLSDAITAFRNVLGVWRLDVSPALWAVTQQRLGDALAALGRRSVGVASLERAAAIYRETLRSTSVADGFIDRVVLRRELARVLGDLGTRLAQPERLQEAIQSLQLLQKPVDPNAAIVVDPETKRILGHGRLSLAKTTRDPLDMAKAARALKEATSVMPEGPMSVAWSAAYRDLGTALTALGTGRRRPPLLKDAVGAFHTALDGVSVDDTPAAWADIQRNLAETHLHLARLGDGKPAADAAIEAFNRLLSTYGDETDPHLIGQAQEGRGDAYLIKARSSEDDVSDDLSKAVTSYREGLAKVDRARSPLLWARLQGKLGDALVFSGGQGGKPAALEESVQAYRRALEIWTPAAAPGERGRVLTSLGNVLADLDGDGRREEAARAFEEAGQLFVTLGASDLAANAEWSLRRPKPATSPRMQARSPAAVPKTAPPPPPPPKTAPPPPPKAATVKRPPPPPPPPSPPKSDSKPPASDATAKAAEAAKVKRDADEPAASKAATAKPAEKSASPTSRASAPAAAAKVEKRDKEAAD